MGKIGKKPGLVYQKDEVRAGETLPYPEVGYGYTGYRLIWKLRLNLTKPELFRSPQRCCSIWQILSAVCSALPVTVI